MRVGCIFFLSTLPEEGITRFAEACLRWTPQIAATAEAVFLEVGKCRGLYGEESLGLRLEPIARRFRLRFRLAFAADPATALAFARWGRGESPIDGIPIEALCDYVDPFGLNPEGLARPAREMASRLRKLGIVSVGQFRGLPAAELSSRFGKLGILVYQRILEADRIPWPRFAPRERIVERAGTEFCQGELSCFQELEPLLFALRPMLDRAMARLKGRAERASLIRLRLELERSSVLPADDAAREWLVRLALPQGASLGILRVIREKLDLELRIRPLAAPVEELELEVVETAPGRGAQRDFFQAREEEIEAWNSLVARLTEKLGQDRVFVARIEERYLPEKGWVRALPAHEGEGEGGAESNAAAFRRLPPRPLRLLRYPEALRRSERAFDGAGVGGALFVLEAADGGPAFPRRRWQVLAVEGPEILSGEWWFRQFQRSYYRVRTRGGEQLWVFRSPGSEAFFLHGYFD